MHKRIKYWSALFLLGISAAAFSSLVGAMYCAAGEQAAASGTCEVAAPRSANTLDAPTCPLATLAEFLVTPMVITSGTLPVVTRPAYVTPLYQSPHYRLDLEAPTKPPWA